ncbi:hypothetical protein [Pararhizobium sp.]|uniref:hypothetical protein n=1 Tax=Pararhizobium sp. TaxID=1977563 RepID=UPI002717477B|nr:hypothetical protein [Pararhizobium sp.]MDO9415887.1 hypothetical protein [Pararhizobium sp.]
MSRIALIAASTMFFAGLALDIATPAMVLTLAAVSRFSMKALVERLVDHDGQREGKTA